MKTPHTVYEVLQLLEQYHAQRGSTYQNLLQASTDERAGIMLRKLAELEEQSRNVVREEREHLDQAHSTYLTLGPALTERLTHASGCRCGAAPSFQDLLACALESDRQLDELLDRLAGCTAAPSVTGLAERLREMEHTKDREISKYTRED